jgi:hypothetical protein
MARRGWGRRWLHLPGEQAGGDGPVPGTRRVGGRYVAAGQGGRRPVYRRGAVRFKSRYEYNYSFFLDFLGIPWVYEPRKFIFHQIQSGTRVYTPDFYLPRSDEYHECKGYDDRRSQTQRKRLKKYYPAIKLVLIDATFFASVERQRLCRVIPGWSCPHTRGST